MTDDGVKMYKIGEKFDISRMIISKLLKKHGNVDK
jgi:hypothetical protein